MSDAPQHQAPREATSVPVLSLSNIARRYRQGRSVLNVFEDVSLALGEGQIVALVGPSGSGKSSLLHIAGLMEAPDAGVVSIDGEDCTGASDDRRTRIRRLGVGFVYQFHHLLPEFSALENVVMPQLIAGESKRAARARAGRLLCDLGLSKRMTHRPAELSGGEQQRVAIARALANSPRLLLADEPTGNLDPDTADEVFAALMRLVRGYGLAALIATHNLELARSMDRVIVLEHGRAVEYQR